MTLPETVAAKLEVARRELLDLTARNRLLNTQRSSSRSSRLEIVDELSEEVFRHLVVEGKTMSFVPASDEKPADSSGNAPDSVAFPENVETLGRPNATESTSPSSVATSPESTATDPAASGPTLLDTPEHGLPLLAQPDETGDEEAGDTAPDPRHVDNRLQTELSSELLQKRLLKLYYDARTYEEEQGVNILFLALGFLKWREPERSDRDRHAPLILIPVTLSRKSARARFRIRYDDEEITTNLSLREKLKVDRQILLPDLPDTDQLSPNEYFDQVEELVAEQDGWEVLRNDIVLWFFSFSRFLMYRDLQPENWPVHRQVDQHPVVSKLLTTGFPADPPLCGEEDSIDPLLDPAKTLHVTDADSSQALAVEESRLGRNLVIQGPPGTGKSQTITNLIAAAVCEGRRVLFVAEKMAALEVVKRRLDALGVGNACLELHSHKASKRAVLRELDETLRLGRPHHVDVEGPASELRSLRQQLNEHADAINEPILPTGRSPFDIIGEFTSLRDAGVPAPDFAIDTCANWEPTDFAQRIELLDDLRPHLAEVGVPTEHLWRGVELETLIPTERDRLIERTRETSESLRTLIKRSSNLASLLKQVPPESLNEVDRLHRLATSVCDAPPLDAEAINNRVWGDRADRIAELLDYGRRGQALRSALEPKLVPLAFSTDVASVRIAVAAHGRSWFRIFNGDYRRAMTTLKGICQGQLPASYGERLQLIDDLLECRKCTEQIERDDSGSRLGQAAFGRLWQGVDSDWTQLQAILDWSQSFEGGNGEHRGVMALLLDADELQQHTAALNDARQQCESHLNDLFTALQFDLQTAFEVRSIDLVALATIAERLAGWSTQAESLSTWIAYRQRRRRLDEQDLVDFGQRIDDGRIVPGEMHDRFRMACSERLVRLVFETHPQLGEFSGLSHEQQIARFRKLDQDHMLLARRRLARMHFDGMPKQVANIGQIGIIRREIQKKRRHLPLRRLFSEAGRAVQAIKPVFMMSPTSIAQFLEPGGVAFDVLVVDEASQVPPVDALGAIARCQQIVVVGDDRQLPPTRFFQRMVDDEDSADSADLHAGHMESILSLCAAQNVTQRMLRWHYRSRHHSLIAVSNREFYRGQLRVIPSPEARSDSLGLRFQFVEDGVFDRGGSATNHNEAKAVVRAIMRHAVEHPNRSLGVGTFSVSQRDAILDELEYERRQHPETESFFAAGEYEPFFVKNLENVQGDERDVIFISVGYGPDEDGKVAMNFGPLSNEGGERRLNVLITRARSRCEVFSSIKAEQIDLKRTKARGTASLKTFLAFAESGELADEQTVATDTSTDLVARVAESLSDRGYQIRKRIGMSGLFVDLGIVDPQNPETYLAGVEFDGPDYQSARSARDRDRTRPAVLKMQGWDVQRVWATDWLQRPQEQINRLIEAIVRVQTPDTSAGSEPQVSESSAAGIERSESTTTGPASVGTLYEEASFAVDSSKPIHELTAAQLGKTLVRILKQEGPVHLEELSKRVASVYGQKRTSRRITESVERSLATLCDSSRAEREAGFYLLPGQEIRIRDRSQADASIRHPDMLPPQEIRAAVIQVLDDHFGATADEAVVETGRRFGFRSTSSVLRERIESIIASMLTNGQLEEHSGWLHVANAADQSSN